MQKTIAIFEYGFDGNNIFLRPDDYEHFQHDNVVMLVFSDWSQIYRHTKIPYALFNKCVRQKSLVVVASNFFLTDAVREYGLDHQRKLIGLNKNVCFGCILQYGGQFSIASHIPNDVSEFVVLCSAHIKSISNVNFDLSGCHHLQNLCYCYISRGYNDLIYDISDDKNIVEYDKFDFKLPYGCVTYIVDDFNKVVKMS